MARGRRLLGQLVLVLAMMAAGFVGAKLGFLGTREVGASHNFNDVPPGAFYHDFVQFLVDNGITAGCGPGLFCGEQAVTRGQMAVFLQKLAAALGDCPPDSVKVGLTCIDKYEASVWEVAPANLGLIQKIKAGTATLAELQAGGFQKGVVSNDYSPGCEINGHGCVNFYAVSIAGVMPSRFLNWVQATAAARNAGKRLPTNAEWQAAALGTADGGLSFPCNNASGVVAATGETGGCVSDAGSFDMVGNLWEWVADWVPRSTGCASGSGWASFGLIDFQCLAGAATDGLPGALLRGGDFNSGMQAGVFAVTGLNAPTLAQNNVGFRAAR